jgi:hypothetical protein
MPHFSDEAQLERLCRIQELTLFLYNRFGIFTSYKGVDAELAAQASPSTLVKPSISRVVY